MRGPGRRLPALPVALAAMLVVFLAGCGDDSGDPVSGAGAQPTPGGSLAVALARTPRNLDPLHAESRAEQLVVRQIDEPLIASLAGPYEDVRRLPGLALSARPSPDKTIWRLGLREGVRFQDGARFNASAVLANAERWRTTSAGRALLPGLVAVDAPRPDLVRFIFDRANPILPRQLASPQLGVVSPRVLGGGGGLAARLARADRTGTGAFELRERTRRTILLARNTAWWGTARDLGPALDQAEFRAVADADQRLGLLENGKVQVAAELGSPQLARLRRDPLLTALAGSGDTAVGLERSVRGFDSATEIPFLSGVWLTRVGTG
jgi:ABC-type transport system substrate-binding protein